MSGRDLDGAALRALLSFISPADPAQGYERTRARLLIFFEVRGAEQADLLADEVMDRVARRVLAGELRSEDPARLILGFARNVLREHWKAHKRRTARLRTLAAEPSHDPPDDGGPDEDHSRRLRCLELSLARLDDGWRQALLEYYDGERTAKIERRRDLAARLDVAAGTLRMRMARTRRRLEAEVKECVERRTVTDRPRRPHQDRGAT